MVGVWVKVAEGSAKEVAVTATVRDGLAVAEAAVVGVTVAVLLRRVRPTCSTINPRQ